MNLLPGAVASGDLSASQFMFVRLSAAASFEVSAITDANAPQLPIGVLQNNPSAAGDPAEVAIVGSVCKVKLGGTVDEGDTLGCNNTGDAIAAPQETGEATADLYTVGVALEAGVDGDYIYILVTAPVLNSTE